ncbi:hypothetical protein KHQ81_00670 [Mycoplasmatota bacterium]|nr:hypothetical protein KHQ81_00670 [Mycoplasmatota bacterium]
MSESNEKVSSISNLMQEQGFNYQFFYFLYKLMNSKRGETIRYEEVDDISIVRINKMEVYQLKYLTSSNISDLSEAFWKTLYNWGSLQGINFSNTTFFIVTNALITNKLVKYIEKYQENVCTFSDIKRRIEDYKNNTSNEDIEKYISDVIENKNMSSILKNIKFIQDINIIEKIYDNLYRFLIPEEKQILFLKKLIGELKLRQFKDTNEKKKFEVTFEEYFKFGCKLADRIRSNKFVESFYECNNIKDFIKKFFIVQAQDIGVVNDEDDIITLSTNYLNYINNMIEIMKYKFATDKEIDDSLKFVIQNWKSVFMECKRLIADDISKGKKCFTDTLNKNIKIGNISLEDITSKGCFLKLSDELRIGWLPKWEEKYKNEE